MRWYLIFLIIFIFLINNTNLIEGATITGKATAQQIGMNISVIAYFPTLEIITPENKTYLTNTSLLLSYSATNYQAIWYNLDLGNNITITSSVYFNTSQGSHTLYLYANSSYGNITSRNVTFVAETPTTPTTPPPTGGGWGAISVTPEEMKLKVEPEYFSVSLSVGIMGHEKINLTNMGNEKLKLDIELVNLEKIVKFKEINLTLNPREKRIIEFEINPGKQPGIYTGKIVLSSKGKKVEIPFALNVRSEKSLFDVSIFIPDEYKHIKPGKKVNAQITIVQLGTQEKTTNVKMNYIVKDFEGKTHLKKSETLDVSKQKSYDYEYQTQNLPVGKYVAGVELVYTGGVVTASAQFDLVEIEKQRILFGIVLITLIKIFMILIIIIKKFRKRFYKHSKIKGVKI